MKIVLVLFLTSMVVHSYAGTPDVCKPIAESLQKACKKIEYATLPKEIQSLMKKQHCNVGFKSNYNYGSQMDLNDDGEFEYLFCCSEASHGPCGARIYAKIDKKWQAIEGKGGLFGFDSECSGISILTSKTEEFHDLWRRSQKPLIEWATSTNARKSIKLYYEKLIPFIYRWGYFNSLVPIKYLLANTVGLFRPMARGPYSRRDSQEVAIKSAALAAENFVLAIAAQEFDTCMMEGFDEARVRCLLKLKCSERVVMVISIGRQDSKGIWGPRFRLPKEQVIKII